MYCDTSRCVSLSIIVSSTSAECAPQFHQRRFSFFLADNPSQVSRVVVAIETLDLNDNAPELDRQYTTAMCDSSSVGQVRTPLPTYPFHHHNPHT